TIHDFAHAFDQESRLVASDQIIPVRTPDQLDDVPARAVEEGFEFLNDFAVTAHRTIQALEVAVDDPNQVVQVFARGQSQGAKRLRFVRLTVADEAPDFGFVTFDDA